MRAARPRYRHGWVRYCGAQALHRRAAFAQKAPQSGEGAGSTGHCRNCSRSHHRKAKRSHLSQGQ